MKEDDEDPEAARPLLEKAERVLRALRDAKAQEPEPEEQPEPEPPKLSFGEILDPIEDKVSNLATLARLIAAHGFNCTIDPSRYQGEQREREVRMLQDVLTGLSYISDEAERLEQFLGQHRMELSKSWPR